MDIMQKLAEQARKVTQRVVFPDGEDENIIKAACKVAIESIANVILIGSEKVINEKAKCLGLDIGGIDITDIFTSAKLSAYMSEYSEIRKMPSVVAKRQMGDPLYYGAMMVRMGDADSMVAGIANDTADMLMASEAVIGMLDGILTPSSFFLMEIPGYKGEEGDMLVFADAAVNTNPSPRCLADIAISTANSTRELLGWEPRVAMLSFSTKGSSSHPHIDKVIEATEIIRSKAPDLAVDGELQVDAAIIPEVARKKVGSNSPVAGKANILIFPDLDSANIGYKLVQRLANAKSYGPVIQGFAKPVSDLSRGATVDDIVGTTIMVSVMAQAQ